MRRTSAPHVSKHTAKKHARPCLVWASMALGVPAWHACAVSVCMCMRGCGKMHAYKATPASKIGQACSQQHAIMTIEDWRPHLIAKVNCALRCCRLWRSFQCRAVPLLCMQYALHPHQDLMMKGLHHCSVNSLLMLARIWPFVVHL